MVSKCVRKFMLVMMELLILILLSVQANNYGPTSFFMSLPSILPPYSSELDEGIISCLTNKIEEKYARIKGTWPFPDFEYEICIFSSFEHCSVNLTHEDRYAYNIINNCIKINCHPKLKIKAIHRRRTRFVSCLLECFEAYLPHFSFIHMQNP
jgi:hypothetical protein